MLGFEKLMSQLIGMQKSRNIWFVINRDPNPLKTSLLHVIRSNAFSTSNPIASSSVVLSYPYIEQDVINKSKSTQMTLEPPTKTNFTMFEQNFKKWLSLNIISKKDFESWTPLIDTMKHIENKSCPVCVNLQGIIKSWRTKKHFTTNHHQARNRQQQQLAQAESNLKAHELWNFETKTQNTNTEISKIFNI